MNVMEYRDARDRMGMALAQFGAAMIMLGSELWRLEMTMSDYLKVVER